MKRAAVLLLTILVLPGCSRGRGYIDRAMELRSRLLSGNGCEFSVDITADYGSEIHSFSMNCTADQYGNLRFTVTAPDTISGIAGEISQKGGQLTFDDSVLQFPLMADDQLTPVSAPWIFLKTLRSGYLTAAGEDGELLRLTIDDTYEEDALHLDIWLNDEQLPIQADILYDGRRILTLGIKDFRIL